MKTVRRKPRGFESLSLRQTGVLPVLLVMLFGALSAACADRGPRRYGEFTGEIREVAVSELLGAPEIHLGRDVAASGTVAQVCQEMGCWFEITDGSRRLMIDLEMGRAFTIPEESAGMKARVEGRLVRQDGVLKVIGRGVELSRG